MLGTEGLWALIASAVKGPEVEEIAHIVGNKRIKDNQVLLLIQSWYYQH
jgi:hypothetical protein